MDFLYSILLGVVQGLTEFWPISSSAHLIIAHDALNFGFVDNLTFDVALHLGTLAALFLFFWRDIVALIVAFFRSFAKWNLANDVQQRLAWYVVVATIPAGIGGWLLESWADTTFRNLWLVSILFIVVGLLFIWTEKKATQQKVLEQATWSTALAIGFAQVLALLPGVSRSGITIVAGMWQGLRREAAARFSFLLSIPVIAGAGLKKVYDATQEGLSSGDWLMMLVGTVSAAVVGYIAIRVLLKFLTGHRLNVFAYYRIIAGTVIIAYLLLR